MLGARRAGLRHDVTIGTRNVPATLASTEPNQITQETFADWHATDTGAGLGTFAEAAEHGEVVVNAVGAHARSMPSARPAGRASTARS